jgi:putative intracellular protease/amidase
MRVLFVLTSIGQLGETGLSTGVAAETLAVPYYALRAGGFEVVLASPAGGAVPLERRDDAASPDSPMAHRFKADPQARMELSDTLRLDQICSEDFDAGVFPGGHGALWDLAGNPLCAGFVAAMMGAGKPLALLSHGPAALCGARDGAGRPLVAGRRVTAFSNAEEATTGLAGTLPLLLETELKWLGALYACDPDGGPFMVHDSPLITGQNPAATSHVVAALLAALN